MSLSFGYVTHQVIRYYNLSLRCTSRPVCLTGGWRNCGWYMGAIVSTSCLFIWFADILGDCVGSDWCVSVIIIFDTVWYCFWVFWLVSTVAHITYTVLVETLNHAQSIQSVIIIASWLATCSDSAVGQLLYTANWAADLSLLDFYPHSIQAEMENSNWSLWISIPQGQILTFVLCLSSYTNDI